MKRLTDKVAIVTGASMGMGRETAELFAAEGAQVIATDIVQPATPYANETIVFMSHDVTKESDWQSVVHQTLQKFGRVDILVNNAGIGGSYNAIHEFTLEDWNHVISVDQTSVFLGMREVIPHMRSAGKGSIVNISSIWGIGGVVGAAGYQAAKGAVRSLTKNAAITYAKENIRVNSVHPGIIHTPLIDRQAGKITQAVISATPMGRAGTPREVAYGSCFLASDEASFITGSELIIDGGYLAQ
jgi:NAD(P)-dependent dehydrogenase (short-subunit alcohol dehydrogenase family)